jgi:dUTP pyrophosphatase
MDLGCFSKNIFYNPTTLKVKKLSDKAIVPTRGSNYSAGYDLYSAYTYSIPARGKELIKTDIAVNIPEDHYGRIAPRSGMAWKNHTDIGAGVIDRDYTGNVGVVLFNHGDRELVVKAGERVAQLILEKNSIFPILECDELEETTRGEGGFGSTGK